VVDGNVAVRLTELGALGVLNLEGLQTRYESPNPILERITQVGNEEFVGLMQELYQEPIKPELVIARIQEIKQRGGHCRCEQYPWTGNHSWLPWRRRRGRICFSCRRR
jgi:IMP dehydrogenase